MHYLSESNILLFLFQVAVLLGLARALGEVFRRWGQSPITAEILVGVILGPTLLGRTLPEVQGMLFPTDALQQNMLETVAWLGILLFLLRSGLETHFATAWHQRRQALTLSLCYLPIPMALAFVPCYFWLAGRLGGEGDRLIAALFVATIMTISALPVTARVLQDLKVYRTDLGLLIMSALTVNDVAGWVVFAMILGVATGASVTWTSLAIIPAATLVFTVLCLSVGSRLFDRLLGQFARWNVSEPSGSLTLVFLTGLLCGAATTGIGIHALFGFFIAGILAGESARLTEHTRHIFAEMVEAVFVPLFFASIGLKLDFLGNFDVTLVCFILAVGISGRYLAAYVGSRLAGQPRLHSRLIADAHIPGGEMQIVIGMVALEYDVIGEAMYVAIVFGAVVSSMLTAPLMERRLKRVRKADWLVHLPVDHILLSVEGENRQDVIRALCTAAAKTEGVNESVIRAKVMQRENEMTTALENGLAVPHARLPRLTHPVVIYGRCARGIDWNAEDGYPVTHLFLVLTPESDPASQLQVLSGIADTFDKPEIRRKIDGEKTAADILQLLRAGYDQKRRRRNRKA